MSSLSGVRCKRTSVSRLVVKFHSQYRCGWILRTPCACCPAVYGSVLIVTMSECIVFFSVQSLLIVQYWGWAVFQYSVVSYELNAGSGGFISCLRRVHNISTLSRDWYSHLLSFHPGCQRSCVMPNFTGVAIHCSG